MKKRARLLSIGALASLGLIFATAVPANAAPMQYHGPYASLTSCTMARGIFAGGALATGTTYISPCVWLDSRRGYYFTSLN